MSASLAWAACVPLGGSAAVFLLRGHAAQRVGLLAAAATAAAGLWAALDVRHSGPLRHAVGGWGAPLGIELFADGFSAAMLATTSFVGVAVSAYAAGHFALRSPAEETERESFWPLWLFSWGALNALFVSGDLFNLYVVLELLTLGGVALVVLGGTKALPAGMRYLLAAVLGSLAYLLGVALLYGAFDALDIATLGRRAQPGAAAALALGLATAGLLVKSALFPLHFWLPPAHASAPAPVSAALSALVVKAGFYLVVRLWFGALPGIGGPTAAQALGVLGALAIVWGSIQALRQDKVKMLVAHSTVAQIGYLFLLFPLVISPGERAAEAVQQAAFSGGVYQAVSHAFAKAAMFLAAGVLLDASGTERLESLRGAASRLPLSVFAFAVGGASLMGLPPTGGFIAKWLLLSAALQSGQWWWAAVMLAGGLLTAGYVFLVLRRAFLPAPEEMAFRPVPRVMELAAAALALGALALGLAARGPLALVRIGAPGGS